LGPADLVYLNGEILPSADAAVSPFDRAFLFAHAAYEVTAVYNGKLIDFEGHVARLQRTLAGIDIPEAIDAQALESLHLDLLSRNNVTEGFVYLQVTGGAYGGRDFVGPDVLKPGLFMFCEARELISDKARDGVTAITVEDQRWKRRDYKTTQLLSQTLAYRQAAKADATSAILHEDGWITEAASANLWIVTPDGTLITRNLGHQILPGITRQSVLKQLSQAGLKVEERAASLEEAGNAAEIFTTAATSLVLPIIRLDGADISNGQPGPVTRRVQALYYQAIGADLPRVAPWLKGLAASRRDIGKAYSES
jgi:D-alanine transaminase